MTFSSSSDFQYRNTNIQIDFALQPNPQYMGADDCTVLLRRSRVRFFFTCIIDSHNFCVLISDVAAYRVRVANELGAGNAKGAKFATLVCVVQSTIVGLFFFAVVMIFQGKLTLIFSTSAAVIEAVHEFSVLLATTILLNSVQPVLSGKFCGCIYGIDSE